MVTSCRWSGTSFQSDHTISPSPPLVAYIYSYHSTSSQIPSNISCSSPSHLSNTLLVWALDSCNGSEGIPSSALSWKHLVNWHSFSHQRRWNSHLLPLCSRLATDSRLARCCQTSCLRCINRGRSCRARDTRPAQSTSIPDEAAITALSLIAAGFRSGNLMATSRLMPTTELCLATSSSLP